MNFTRPNNRFSVNNPWISGQEIITRDCLSSIKGFRTDLPADKYEGCRPATVDVKLANYVNNTIKEIDIKRFVLLLNIFKIHVIFN